ncbi:MAG: transglycosylase SLT domain-containing protein [Anaerolineae bacterium]
MTTTSNPLRLLLPWLTGLALLIGLAACSRSEPLPTPTAGVEALRPALTADAASSGTEAPRAVLTPSEPTATAVPATAAPEQTPTQELTALPTALPPSTATPTPALPASARMAEARRLHLNGDFAAAQALYAAIVQDDPASAEASQARWRLGQAYLEDGQPTAAFAALELARQQLPADALPPEVDFWIGEALGQIGNPSGAVEAYRRYLARNDALSGEVYLRIGRALAAAGDTAGAMDALSQSAATATDNFVRFAAREDLAGLHEEQDDRAAALAELDQILAVSQFARYRAELQQRAGDLLLAAGQTEEAAARFRRAIAEDGQSSGALNAANALADLGQPLDDLAYGRILLGNGVYAAGIAAIYRYFEAVPDHPAEPHLLVAEAYFSQREYTRALAEWQSLLDTHPEYTDRAGVLIRMAVAQGRLGNRGAARDLYRQVGTAAALLEAARLAERDGDCRTAATEYLDIVRLYPNAAEAGEGLLRGGVCQYRLGQTASALESWQRLIDGYPANTYAHAGRFWAGKATLELGDAARAVSLWQLLQREAADSYYTARAQELAVQAGLSDAASLAIQAARPAADDDGSQAAAERWLANWAAPGGTDPASLRQLPAAVAADPQVQRGAAYLAAGLRAEAIRELDEVRERYRDDPLALYALAQHFDELRLYRHATLAAIRLAALSPDGLFGAPLYIQRLAYPIHYSDIVEAEAAAQGVDPLLIYALIRQESFFEQGARSSAAAQGLTQVIPSTAEWIAGAMGWPNFQPGDIYKPYLNVKFGTYYLRAALDMFDGNPYPALVGYNAGPGNARYWLEQAQTGDDDLYVEEITVNEPKLYVRRVLAHLAQYVRLYGGG